MSIEHDLAQGWDADTIRGLGYAVVDLIADYLAALPGQPVFRAVPEEQIASYFSRPVPEEGEDLSAIIEQVRENVLCYPFGNGHPRFWGWVNSPPTLAGILGDAVAAAMNPSCAGGNHAAIHLERQVLGWLKQLVGFPQDAGGLLVGGGSLASLTGLAVARHVHSGCDVRQDGLHAAPRPLAVYVSSETHSAVRKSIELMGLGSRSLRLVPVDDRLRIRADALRHAILEDRARGIQPMAVVATAGTASTGAVDPLSSIADICAEQRVWLHVDGAYGAPAVLSGQYRDELRPLERADSVALDPHKWLGVPVEAGAILVRNESDMRATFRLVPPYLQASGSEDPVHGPPWFSEIGFQQTRGFRALKVWMSLKHFGLRGYARMIERQLELAGLLAEEIRRSTSLQIVGTPSLSIVCFRYLPQESAADRAVLDSFNRVLLRRIQTGGQVFLSGTLVKEEFALRACIVNHRSTPDDVRFAVRHVQEEGQKLASETGLNACV
jgi:glutamate/tyrosine decarboxylase-like PLP-dependent enzyme